MTILVNKNYLFNEQDISNFELVEYDNFIEDTLYVESDAFRHFEMLKAHLRIEGIIIDIYDAYRSLERQESIFLEYMNKYGINDAEVLCAMPGTSDHHTAQAIDIALKVNDTWVYGDKLFDYENILIKIHKVLKYFGFVLRYPVGKENITGFSYEPWHFRYVGDAIAMEIGDLCLEKYLCK